MGSFNVARDFKPERSLMVYVFSSGGLIMFGRLFTVAIFSVALAIPVVAQNPKREQKQAKVEKKAAKNKDGAEALKLQKKLNLSEEQTSQVRALLAERDRRSGGLKGKDAKAARQQFMTSLRGILTPEQLEKLDERRAGKKR
jgi:hypothetical protein